jgi:hypothetical protein
MFPALHDVGGLGELGGLDEEDETTEGDGLGEVDQISLCVASTSTVQGKYKWDKNHSCKFCSKQVLKMSTHLQDMHADEPEVASILCLEKG